MFETVRTTLMTRWLANSRRIWRRMPVPPGPPAAHTDGPDPDRVLLFGSGIAMGYGVPSHDLALAGQIAHRVSELTRRGVRVDVIAAESLSSRDVVEHLTVSRLRALDAVVLTPGSLEHVILMPIAQWRQVIEEQLDHFAANAPASLRVVFVAVPEVSQILPAPTLLAFFGDRSARALNRELERLCAEREYVTFVPFQPLAPTDLSATGNAYGEWAGLIAPAVASALDEHHHRVST